jgi:hypothetical protein
MITGVLGEKVNENVEVSGFGINEKITNTEIQIT